jgi:hypothetical protein
MERAGLPAEKRRFLFSVYLAGDNDLAEEMVWNVQEMRAANEIPSVRECVEVVALFDPPGGEPRIYDFRAPEPERRKAEAPTRLLAALLERADEGRRILVLSGHGSGAVGDFLNDEHPRSSLSIPRLGEILRGRSIEVLGLDSCQMSTVEVGYEVRSAVAFLIASEGPVLNTGWPYRQTLEAVSENRAGSTAAVALAIAESYLRFYREYEIAGLSTDVAACDLSKIGDVADAVASLARAMVGSLRELEPDGLEEALELSGSRPEKDAPRAVRDAIVLAHWSAQSYKCDRYTDLYDFARQLLRFAARGSEIRTTCQGVLDAVDAAIVTAGTTGAELQHSHGLSIYFPWSERDFFPEYRNLRFAEETGWATFLEVYLGATRRMRRFQGEASGPPSRMPDPRSARTTKDVEAGTRKDVEAGTRKGGKNCRSTMKNPPDGYYPR